MSVRLPAGHYFGVTGAQVRLGDLILSDLTYARNADLPEHSHANAFMILVLHGTQIEDLRGGRRCYKRGTLALHPAEEMHRHQIGSQGLKCLNVEFGTNWLEKNPHVSRALKKSVYFETNRFASIGLIGRAIYTEFRDLDDVSPLAIEACVLSLLAEISRSDSFSARAKPNWLKKAHDILHGCYSEPLSLKT